MTLTVLIYVIKPLVCNHYTKLQYRFIIHFYRMSFVNVVKIYTLILLIILYLNTTGEKSI